MTSTQPGFLIGFKELSLWLFPQDPPSLDAKSGSITYTMSSDSSSLRIGNSVEVGELAKALLGMIGEAATTEATAAVKSVTDQLGVQGLWAQIPEPFKSAVNTVTATIAALEYHLESLRLRLEYTTDASGTRKWTASYEMGVSVQVNQAAPGPLKDFKLKRIYLKLKS